MPAGKRGAAVVVVDDDGLTTLGVATRLGDDWAVGAEVAVPLRDPKAATARIIIAGSW